MTAIHIEEGDWHSLKHECERVRLMVFVAEQKVPKDEELDEWDEASRHFVAKDERRMVLGCARLLPTGQIGRLAVLRPFRKRGVGRALLDAVLRSAKAAGMKEVFMNAQVHAEPFYERAGFVSEGERFMDAGIEHVRMRRSL